MLINGGSHGQRAFAVRGTADPVEPRLVGEHLHDHEEEVSYEVAAETVDLSEIAASVEASVAAVARDVANPVGLQVAALENRLNAPSHDIHARRAEAKMKGYEGDACGTCGNFTLVRNGTCMKCNTCGSTSGCS